MGTDRNKVAELAVTRAFFLSFFLSFFLLLLLLLLLPLDIA